MGGVRGARQRRSSQLVFWSPLPVAAIAVWVQVTHTGLDVLLLGFAALVALALERTVGDWLGELIGAIPAGIAFAILIGASAWFVLEADAGRDRTEAFFKAAEQRGYTAVLFAPSIPKSPVAAASSPVSTPARGVGSSGTSVRKRAEAVFPYPEESARRTESTSAEESRKKAGSPAPVTAADIGEPSPPVRWRILGGEATPTALVPSRVALQASPPEVRLALYSDIRASVTAGGRPVTEGSVQFSLDGLGLGSVLVDRNGIAMTKVSSSIAGPHEIRARFTGTNRLDGATATLVLNVLAPGR